MTTIEIEIFLNKIIVLSSMFDLVTDASVGIGGQVRRKNDARIVVIHRIRVGDADIRAREPLVKFRCANQCTVRVTHGATDQLDEVAAMFQHPRDGLIDFRLDPPALRMQVDEGNVFSHIFV